MLYYYFYITKDFENLYLSFLFIFIHSGEYILNYEKKINIIFLFSFLVTFFPIKNTIFKSYILAKHLKSKPILVLIFFILSIVKFQ